MDLSTGGIIVKETFEFSVQVLKALQEKYGDLYRRENVVMSGTHTHCGPGGYFQYTLFMITGNGYVKESTEPLVNGIVKVCVTPDVCF